MILFKLLEVIEAATGIKPEPFITSKLKDGIVYNFRVFTDTGSIANAMLEIRIIDDDLMRIEQLNKNIRTALLSFGDGSPVDGVSSLFINGESYLPIDEIIQKITNFSITYRSDF